MADKKDEPVFGAFDFKILDDPNFKEDSVREELVVPILKRLGYSASGEHKIIRSEPLEHPFVYIGTKPHKVNIFPDYQLAPAGKREWVLDAKAPGEEIHTGPNVEQAFSYAIHREVRTMLYGLCNGRELVIFHVSELEPKLVVDLKDIDARWKDVWNLLSPLAFTNPAALHYLPDFGLTLQKAGHGHFEHMYFPLMAFGYVGKARDDLYTLVANFEMGEAYCASFDLTPELYRDFLEAVTPRQRAVIQEALSQHPWGVRFEHDKPEVTIDAKLAGYTVKLPNEDYAPLKVLEVVKPKLREGAG